MAAEHDPDAPTATLAPYEGAEEDAEGTNDADPTNDKGEPEGAS
jgi:hypothetical protein